MEPAKSPLPERCIVVSCQMTLTLALFFLTSGVLTCASGGDTLCARCETNVISRLRRHYDSVSSREGVTFQQFVRNLLSQMESEPRLKPLRQELLLQISRYNDCVRTCEIPFTKRTSFSQTLQKILRKRSKDSDLDELFLLGRNNQVEPESLLEQMLQDLGYIKR